MNLDYSASREIIHQSSLLSEEDTAFLDDNISQIQLAWEKRQIFRTETEMRMSVLQDYKFPTIAAKYWQAVRELSVMYETLVQTSFDYRRNDIAILRCERAIERADDELDKAALKIDLEELQWKKLNLHQTATDRAREIKLWTQIMKELREADPTFDSEDVNKHQLASYTARFENQLQNIEGATPGERTNLLGQLHTAKRIQKERAATTGRLELKEGGLALRWEQ